MYDEPLVRGVRACKEEDDDSTSTTQGTMGAQAAAPALAFVLGPSAREEHNLKEDGVCAACGRKEEVAGVPEAAVDRNELFLGEFAPSEERRQEREARKLKHERAKSEGRAKRKSQGDKKANCCLVGLFTCASIPCLLCCLSGSSETNAELWRARCYSCCRLCSKRVGLRSYDRSHARRTCRCTKRCTTSGGAHPVS